MGGVFDGLQSVPRNGLAGFDATTGQILPFNPPLPTTYFGKKMVIRGDTLFALVQTNGLGAAVEQDRLLLYDLSTGTQLSSPTDNWSSMADFIFDGNYMYTSSGNYIRRYVLPGLGLDGGWLANFDLPEASEPQGLCQDSTSIYTVGDNRTGAGSEFPGVQYVRFSRIDKANSANISNYQYVDTAKQIVDPRPQFNHAVLRDSLIFVQGRFSSLNGTVARNLAAINIHTGNVLNYSPAYYGPNAAPYSYNQPFQAAMKFQPMNGVIWYGYDPIPPLATYSFPLSFGAIDSATGIFLPPPFTLGAGPSNDGSVGADAVSSQLIWNVVNDFLLDPDQPVLVGSFGEINGQPSRCIVRLTYGTYSAPLVAQSIAGPDTAVAGSDSVQYSLADTLGYNWSYSGSNVTVVNNGQDPVFLSFAANATGGVLSASGKGYCNSTVSGTPKNIVVIQVTPAPKVNGCCMLFNNTQTTRTSLSFSPGNGTGRLVVASTSPITSLPVLGTVYNANATFGTGSDLGGGNFVVYAGVGDSLTVTGLQNTTKYYFAVFEYAVSNDTIKYQLQQPYSDSMTTLSPAPTLAPSNIQFSHVGTTSLTISCTAGNGNGRIFLLKAADSIRALPQDGIAYRANTLFLYGSAFADGSYVVANTGTGANVTGLSPGTTYYVKIFEYAGAGGATDYLTSAWAADTVTTAIPPPPPPPPPAPTVNASAITVTNITTSTATVSCVPGNGQNRLFAIRAQGIIIDTPLSSHAYAASPVFGAGGNIGDSTFVLAASGTSVAIAGLSAGTNYSVAVFEYNGSGDSTVYMGHSFPSGAFTTAAIPSTQPTVNWQDSGFSVKAYPNPAHGTSLLRITSNGTGTITFRIVAFGGNQLEGFSFAIVPGINTFPLPYLAGLPRGIYILYWRTNDQKGSVSIIKL